MTTTDGVDDRNKTKAELIAELVQLREVVRTRPMAPSYAASANQKLQAALRATQEELQQQSLQLAIERQRYLELFNFSLDGYLVTDAFGKILEANQAIASLLAAPQSNLVGQPLAVFVADYDRQVFYAKLNQLSSLPQQHWELALKPGKGRSFPAAVTVAPLCNASNEQVGLRWIVRDLSEQHAILRERQQVAAALQHSEERLLLTLKATQMGIWSWNLLTGEVNWSHGHEQLFGLSSGSFDGRYETFVACLHPDEREAFGQVVSRVLQDRVPFHHEYRVVWADGTVHWIESKGQVFYDELGQAVRVMGTALDVSDRKQSETECQQAEAALRDSEARYRAIVETQTELIVRSSAETLISFVNEAVCRSSGYSREALIGQNWQDFVHPTDLATALDGIAALTPENSCFVMEQRNLLAQGEVRWFHWTNQGIFDPQGQLVELLSVGWDITERRQAEAALRQSEAYFRILFEQSPIAMGIDRLDHHPVKVNQAFCDLLGYTSEELQSLTFIDFTHPADIATDMALSQKLVEGEISRYQLEKRYIRKDGEVINVLLNATLMRDPQGQPLHFIVQVVDITERKQAETALHQSEERWQLAIAGTNDGIWDHNLLTNQHVLSPRCLEILGYAAEEMSKLDNFCGWLNQVHPEDTALLQATFEHHLDKRTQHYSCEYRIRCKNGSYKWVLARGQALWDETGTPVRAVGSLTDISDRKRVEDGRRYIEAVLMQAKEDLEVRVAERTTELTHANLRLQQELLERERTEIELQNNRTLLQAIIDNSPAVIYLYDLEGTYLLINSGQGTIAELTRSEVIGKTTHEIWPPEIADSFVANNQKVLESRQPLEFEEFVPHEDGLHTYLTIKFPLMDAHGVPYALCGISTDITERVRIEASLRESERRWRSLLENVRLMVIGVDLRGNINYVNPFLQEVTGYTSDEVLGKNIFELFIPPQQRPQTAMQFQEMLTQELHTYYQLCVLTKSGEERMTAWNITVLRDLQGDVTGVLSIGEDITERSLINRMKDEFVSVVSHELRTPLTSIHGALNLLAEGLVAAESDRGQRVIEIAAEAADRLVRLVDDILDLERLESGKISLIKQPCNLADLITRAVNLMQVMANSANVILSVSPLAVQADVDGDRILQVLTNLLSNAIKFSQSGGLVWLNAHLLESEEYEQLKLTQPSLLSSQISPLSPQVLFTVQDQGRGIPVDRLETIFERFQQVDASDSRRKGGTGLGLAICRSIVQQHGGQIWAESVLGEGSCFYFTIPLEPDEG